MDNLEDIRTFVTTLEESKDHERLLSKLLTMKIIEDMARSLQDKASKYQLNFIAEDTTPLPKSAQVVFSKPSKTNWTHYEVLFNFTTEVGKTGGFGSQRAKKRSNGKNSRCL